MNRPAVAALGAAIGATLPPPDSAVAAYVFPYPYSSTSSVPPPRRECEEVGKHGHVSAPGKVGAEAQDGEPFVMRMRRLAVTLCEQQNEATKHGNVIAAHLKELGFGG